MSNYIETMRTLLQAKKENNKKEPSSAEKKVFLEAWKGLVKESGFSGEAEKYLYNGFRFCGSEPFYWYLGNSKEKNGVLNQLFNGRLYGEDSNATFRVLTHLFALLLNGDAPQTVLSPVIKHFPSACVNKEGNRLGTAAKTMEKYFFNILSPSANLIPLTDFDIESSLMRSFVSNLSILIEELKGNKTLREPAITNIARVSDWASSYLDISYGKRTSERMGETVEDQNKKEIPRSFDQMEIHNSPHNDSLTNIIRQALALSESVEKEREQHRIHNTELEASIAETKQKLAQSEETVKELEGTVQELTAKVWSKERECDALRQLLSDKDAIIEHKNTEIEEWRKMLDALSRDRSRQVDERLQRIASKIRIEYRDFKDAIDVEMTPDLGENLRLQLISIFDILEKGGMKIQ